MSYSVRPDDEPSREVFALPETRVAEIPVSLNARPGLRWEYQTKRDEELFRRGWYADFKTIWQRDLREHRDQFRARMEEL